jgi:hypothetical protein
MDGCWGQIFGFVGEQHLFLFTHCFCGAGSDFCFIVRRWNVEASYPYCDFLSFSSVHTQNTRIASLN